MNYLAIIMLSATERVTGVAMGAFEKVWIALLIILSAILLPIVLLALWLNEVRKPKSRASRR